jgi:hypothetical protein
MIGKYEHLHTEGCQMMYAAHIRECLKDFVVFHKNYEKMLALYRKEKSRNKKNHIGDNLRCYEDARHFLFSPALDIALAIYAIPLSPSYIRKMARIFAVKGEMPTNIPIVRDEE